MFLKSVSIDLINAFCLSRDICVCIYMYMYVEHEKFL